MIFDVRSIDPGVGADKAVACFADDDSALHAYNAPGFPENKLDKTRVFVELFGEAKSLGRRLDGSQIDDLPLDFGNDLLCDDNDRVVAPNMVFALGGGEDLVRQIVAGTKLGKGRERFECDLRRCLHGVLRERRSTDGSGPTEGVDAAEVVEDVVVPIRVSVDLEQVLRCVEVQGDAVRA